MVIAGWPAPTSCPGSARRCTITPSAGARISPSCATTTDCSSTAAARSASARAAAVCFGREPSRARREPLFARLQRGARALELGARAVAVARVPRLLRVERGAAAAPLPSPPAPPPRGGPRPRPRRPRSPPRGCPTAGPRARASAARTPACSRSTAIDVSPRSTRTSSVAGLDAVAFAHEHLGHAARHLRPEVDGDRLDAAVEMGDVVLAPRPRSSAASGADGERGEQPTTRSSRTSAAFPGGAARRRGGAGAASRPWRKRLPTWRARWAGVWSATGRPAERATRWRIGVGGAQVHQRADQRDVGEQRIGGAEHALLDAFGEDVARRRGRRRPAARTSRRAGSGRRRRPRA